MEEASQMIGRTKGPSLATAVVALAVFTVFGGCGGGDSTNKVGTTLQEYKIIPNSDTVKAGKVKLETDNVGGSTHELVVVRADDPASLPTKPDGSVDEARIPAGDKVGEIEDVTPHQKKSATFELDPGSYVFFCNIVDKGNPPISHFQKGMSVRISVSQ
jgi:hypothetical protein